MDRKQLFQNDLNDVDTFRDMGKNRVLKVIYKKRASSWNVEIFGYMGKKRLFESDLEIT